jgi:subtilisin family serine protease
MTWSDRETPHIMHFPNRIISAVLGLCCISAAAHAQLAVEVLDGKKVASGEAIIRLRTVNSAALQRVTNGLALDRIDRLNAEGAYRIRSVTRSAAALLQQFAANPDLVYAEPNYILKVNATAPDPGDDQYAQQWALNNTGQNGGTPGADIKAAYAWNVSTGSAGVVVGIIDTGIDYNHPDLQLNLWNNTRSVGGCAGTHGFNSLTGACDGFDDHSHGTQVAGIIGASGANSIGIAGINWTTRMMALKAFDNLGYGTVSSVISAMEFAIAAQAAGEPVRVLACSWGIQGASSLSLRDEIDKAATKDMLFVTSAGDNVGSNIDVYPYYPASFKRPNMISVTSTDKSDALAGMANYGASTVDLGAPGDNILSTYPAGTYTSWSGTSLAAAHVAGAAALILSTGTFDTATLKAKINGSVDPKASLTGKTITGGRLNVCRAIGCTGPQQPGYTITVNPVSQSVLAGGTATYTVTLSSLNGFYGGVALSARDYPANTTVSFTPASISLAPGASAPSTLQLKTTGETQGGAFKVSVIGTSGSTVVPVPITLSVKSFTISVSPSSQTVKAGSTATYAVMVSPQEGFSGTVTLTVSGLPSRATATFTPKSLVPPAQSRLDISTAARTAGTYTITLTATSGGIAQKVAVKLVLN